MINCFLHLNDPISHRSNLFNLLDREMILKLLMLNSHNLLSLMKQKIKLEELQTGSTMKGLLKMQKKQVFLEREELVDLGDHLRGSRIKKGS